ncbi:HGGxSTG domain-containing protein [Agrobacterium albertimagni]|uniref:HGGxSTG domain-containing protein n=1 Tax=Agrobacterium albertimagni TaxID=147266 RepID=UPI0012FD3BB5|nr:HGGxSTG domain-containing protein [Agrobacterium albertimagni]
MAERTPRQKAWASHGLKEVGRAVLDRFNKEVRPHLPKCNGTSRSTGEPCGNPAVAGKQKCRWHGGAVPSGDEWHKLQYPAATSKDWQRKLNEKLKRAERDRRRKERRLAKTTPEQRAKHQEWQRSHKPGSKAERQRKRADRKIAQEFKALTEQPERPASPELAALQAHAAYLEAERDRYRALAQAEQQATTGVFD